jgi:hypothetical protein
VAPWAAVVGLSDFELYVGGGDERGIRALSLALPTLVLGRDLHPPFGAAERAALLAALFSLAEGTTAITNRSPEDGASLLAAVGRAAGDETANAAAPSAAAPSAELEERFRRALDHDVIEQLPADWVAAKNELSGRSLASFCAELLESALCAGALATGEPSTAFAGARDRLAAVAPDSEGAPAREAVLATLVSFTLSDEFSRLRGILGLSTAMRSTP